MSIEVVAQALNTEIPGGPAMKLVLIGLANHAGADGKHAFPSRHVLARYAGCTPRTVSTYLSSLNRLGYVEITARATRYRPTEYRIRLEKLSTLPSRVETASSSQGRNHVDSRVEVAASSRTVLEPSMEPSLAPSPNGNGHKARDEFFENILETCHYDLGHLTKTERGRANSAAKELRAVTNDPELILGFGDVWREAGRGEITPQTITGNWAAYMAGSIRALRRGR